MARVLKRRYEYDAAPFTMPKDEAGLLGKHYGTVDAIRTVR